MHFMVKVKHITRNSVEFESINHPNNAIPDVRNRQMCMISKCETEWLSINIPDT
jgi:hypothetical protein